MRLRIFRYVAAFAGFTVFTLIALTADYSVLTESLTFFDFSFILTLAVVSSVLGSISFAILANLEFPKVGNRSYFFQQSISATLANFGIPLAGTSSKLASLKSAGIKLSEILGVLVSISLVRALAALLLALSFSPIDLFVKLTAIALALLGYVLWSKGLLTSFISSRLGSLKPSGSLMKSTNSVFLLVIELVSISFSGLVLFAIWQTFSANASPTVSMFAAGLASFVSVVPISPGAIGTKDSAVFLAFSLSGVVEGAAGALVMASRLVGIIALSLVNIFVLVARLQKR